MRRLRVLLLVVLFLGIAPDVVIGKPHAWNQKPLKFQGACSNGYRALLTEIFHDQQDFEYEVSTIPFLLLFVDSLSPSRGKAAFYIPICGSKDNVNKMNAHERQPPTFITHESKEKVCLIGS
jgi:hypothetical protein